MKDEINRIPSVEFELAKLKMYAVSLEITKYS